MERFYSNGFQFDDEDDNEKTCNGNITQHQQTIIKKKKGPYYNDDNERIIGCIVGSFLPSNLPSKKHRSTLNEAIPRDETAQLLIPNCNTHPRMFYIMTLGTTKEFRRFGLGSILVNKVVDMIQEQHNEDLICGALYLHVILYNKGAIRLYERLGFMKVKLIKDYYTINSVNYDCYLYAKYFWGNRGHQTTVDLLYGYASSILHKLIHPFS